MRKLLISLLAVSSTASFALGNNSEFQEFDNQISIGGGINSTTANTGSINAGSGNTYSSNGNMLNFEAERLFNNGVWVDVNAYMQFGGGPTTPPLSEAAISGNPSLSNISTSPYISPAYGINGKVGYGFSLLNQHLMLTPYILLGVNSSQNTAVSDVATATPLNSANSYMYNAGGGGRLEYRVNHWLDIYADQNIAYAWDQSQPDYGIAAQNFLSYTSTLGAKFNLAPNFQLGVRGWYTGYQYAAGSNEFLQSGTIAQATSTFGGLISVGLTY